MKEMRRNGIQIDGPALMMTSGSVLVREETEEDKGRERERVFFFDFWAILGWGGVLRERKKIQQGGLHTRTHARSQRDWYKMAKNVCWSFHKMRGRVERTWREIKGRCKNTSLSYRRGE